MRFFIHEKTKYAEATHKALVIIGDKAAKVKSRVQHVAETLKSKKGILEIIGLFKVEVPTRPIEGSIYGNNACESK